ncbi:hypothetical protein MNBD_ALPHA06-317 [hydrothermal vent metagenome]|uniref:DNA gyrase inhibitor YacG n=1 Tax=hydrothermal vent metagenome TaxID=652676 RepID=A0A3B0R2W0_9ZZZZ
MKCVICKKPALAAHKPFCSDRCKQVDLGRWLKGVYAIPVADDDDGQPPLADIDNQ